MKKQTTEQKKISANHLSYKELIPKIKETVTAEKKSDLNMGKGIAQAFLKSRHMKRYKDL